MSNSRGSQFSPSRRRMLQGGVSAAGAMTAGACASSGAGTGGQWSDGEAGLASSSSAHAVRSKPNIVLIVLDDVGFADLGCFGSEIATPAIDSLASAGLRFTNFHTTGVCAATRASLLTGLNPHSAGIGWLTYEDAGSPGYRGDLSPNAITMAEAFLGAGYNTYHCGKWHVNSDDSVGNTGPMYNWPSHRGFLRSYWFQGHSTDFFRPTNLFDGNERVDPEAGFYATDAFTNRAITYLAEHVAHSPQAPFFLMLAHPAAHSPLQAPPQDIQAQRGRYDRGWDEVRTSRFARQRELGLFAESVPLPMRNPGERSWDSLSEDERRLFARYMEVYGAMIRRIDHGIARIVEFLRSADLLDDTIIALMSDNGGSPDGGANGTPNMLAGRSGGVTIPEAVAVLESIGGPDSYAMYPTGWAAASNTPFRLYKHDTHLGGVADPLIIQWPRGISDGGQLRRQYAHACDLLPTLAKCADIAIPHERNGVAARPIQGTSFDAALLRADAPESRLEQHFELSGSRAIYTDGWRLVSTGRFRQPNDRWELFDVRVDPNETNDLARARPDIVQRLEQRWFAAAERYDVLPIDTRSQRDKSFANFYVGGERTQWRYFPPIDLIQPEAAPELFGRSHSVEIATEALSASDEGVLFAYGNMFLGCAAFIQRGRLHYEYRSWPNRVHRISANVRPGVDTIRIDHQLTARPWVGVTTISVNEDVVAELASDRWPFGRTFQGLQIGQNVGVPVSSGYNAPFAFTGIIQRVRISLDNSPYTPQEINRANSPPV